jgi:hypothetical protein
VGYDDSAFDGPGIGDMSVQTTLHPSQGMATRIIPGVAYEQRKSSCDLKYHAPLSTAHISYPLALQSCVFHVYHGTIIFCC